VLIPDDYVADLSVRLALYRRLSEIQDEKEIDPFAAELVDRFGKIPVEVEHLLRIVAVKTLCRRANVEKIDAGPKGAVIAFRDNTFANPGALIGFIREQGNAAKVRPDMKVVFFQTWEEPEERLKGTMEILRRLVAIAEMAQAA
jgi:transcription-repair coupling factor (superfamily II helicase)